MLFHENILPLQFGIRNLKTNVMTIHKAGYKLLLKIAAALVVLNAVVIYVLGNTVTTHVVWVASLVVYILIVNFFRSPNRIVLLDDNGRRLQVSIFMSLFNVHVNWFPVNGVIRYFKYHAGKFAAAYLPKSSTENERTSIAIECANGQTILMRQIAGAMAKRIVSYAPVGRQTRQDQHAGFIKFGSRVDLFLPLDTKIEVKLGQKTKGSQTIIGTFK